MKLQRKGTTAIEPVAPEPAAEVVGKGRATPKRRDTAPKKQPIAAPRTTKEANRLRKQQSAQARKRPAGGKAMNTREVRAAMKRGDESVLLRRDKGPVRRLARDWTDSHRLASNYLLIALPVVFVGGNLLRSHLATYLTLAVFLLFAVEWFWAGRRIHTLASARFERVSDKAWVLGFYAGQRAMMPRRWRTPEPKVSPGDKI